MAPLDLRPQASSPARSPSRFARLAAVAFAALALLPSRALAGANGACMGTEFGGNLNCTANDVSISAIDVLQIVDGCSGPGDTAQLKLRATLQVTSNERYDIGWYIATDGGDAQTGSCFKEYLPPPFLPNPTNADLATGFGPYFEDPADGDQCGDATQNDVTVDPLKRPSGC